VIFAADVAALLGVYTLKGVWAEVYGLQVGADGGDGPAGER